MPDPTGQNVFVSFNGDKIGDAMSLAALQDDVSKVRRLSQDVERGTSLWGSWALASLGTAISLGGDAGRLQVPASHLGELQQLRNQYHSAVGCSCSVGVGMTLAEADIALEYAKLHGRDRVCFFTPDVGEEVQAEADNHMSKAEASGPGVPQPQVSQQAGSGSQGQQALRTFGAGAAARMDGPSTPTAASQVSGAPPVEEQEQQPSGPEQRLHEHALKQKQQDSATAAVSAQQNDRDALKQQVVKVLKQVKAAAPMLEEVKGQAPEIYKAMMGAVQAMVAMAKQLGGGGGGGGENASTPASGDSDSPGAEKSKPGLAKAETDLKKMACIHDDAAHPTTVYRVQNARGQGPYHTASVERDRQGDTEATPAPHKDFSDDYRAYSDLISEEAKNRGLFGFERPEHAEQWFGREGMNKLRMAGFEVVPVQAARVHRSMTGRQVFFQPAGEHPALGADAAEMRRRDLAGHTPNFKAEKLPMPNAGSAKPHLNLPVGATDTKGRVKVRHSDGRAGWVEVRAGMVMSQDGHPISSRNPGGR